MGKALIAMSGGVDSSVAAYLMQEKGFTCGGAIMQLWKEVSSGAIADAQAVADRLGMDFHILDASEAFRQQVVEYFIRSYEEGLTPNPCIQCNKHLNLIIERQSVFFKDVCNDHTVDKLCGNRRCNFFINSVGIQKLIFVDTVGNCGVAGSDSGVVGIFLGRNVKNSRNERKR